MLFRMDFKLEEMKCQTNKNTQLLWKNAEEEGKKEKETDRPKWYKEQDS